MSRVVHFEIHAEKPERAAKFYAAVFGWTIQKWAGPVDYWLITTGSAEQRGIDGGLLLRRGPAPAEGQPVNAYVCTISVASVDDSVAAVIANGGTIVLAKMPVPGVGWAAHAKDTEGNIFGMLQPDPAAKMPG
ncbi:MAG TPA: VOC family protein [Gemmataceae bacterium]|nr:VOC family protein [Gemmataceae bacterium]